MHRVGSRNPITIETQISNSLAVLISLPRPPASRIHHRPFQLFTLTHLVVTTPCLNRLHTQVDPRPPNRTTTRPLPDPVTALLTSLSYKSQPVIQSLTITSLFHRKPGVPVPIPWHSLVYSPRLRSRLQSLRQRAILQSSNSGKSRDRHILNQRRRRRLHGHPRTTLNASLPKNLLYRVSKRIPRHERFWPKNPRQPCPSQRRSFECQPKLSKRRVKSWPRQSKKLTRWNSAISTYLSLHMSRQKLSNEGRSGNWRSSKKRPKDAR